MSKTTNNLKDMNGVFIADKFMKI